MRMYMIGMEKVAGKQQTKLKIKLQSKIDV